MTLPSSETAGPFFFQSHDLREVEQQLRSISGVEDGVVLARADIQGILRLIAYVVPSNAFNAKHAEEQLRGSLAERLWPAGIVTVSVLPVDGTGDIDEKLLTSFPVLEPRMAAALEHRLVSLPTIEAARAFITPISPDRAAVPLAELSVLRDLRATPPSRVASPASVPEPTVSAPSLSHGETLRTPVPNNLAEALSRACRTGHGIGYVAPDGTEHRQLYSSLEEEAQRILSGLRFAGCRKGSVALLLFDRISDFVPAFWACMLGGITAVPLATAAAFDKMNPEVLKLHRVWTLLDKPLILSRTGLTEGIHKLADELDLCGWRVQGIDELRSHLPVAPTADVGPADDALILFTSGSTGEAKGVVLTHSAILHRSAAAAQVHAMDERDRSLNWFPLDHVGGLVMSHIYDVFLGSEQVLAPAEYILESPLRWLDLIDKHRVSYTWAPNFAYALVNARERQIAEAQWDLSCVRVFLNGGEAVVNQTANRFLHLLAPHGLRSTAMRPSWGMSETSSGITICTRFERDRYQADTAFVEVGSPVPGASIRIVDSKNDILPEGQIGHLQAQGPMITRGYYGNPRLNQDSFTADGWFLTGDLAVLREGRLTITGRSKDVIIVNGVNYASHEIEAVVEEIDGVQVTFTAACAVRPAASQTDQLCVFFCPGESQDQSLLIDTIRETILQRVGIAPAFVVPVTPDLIPKTAIGKIQRSALRARFEKGEFDGILTAQAGRSNAEGTLPDWFFERRWFAKRGHTSSKERAKGPYLVVGDADGIAARAVAELGQRVESIPPGEMPHYTHALVEFARAGFSPRHVVYEWLGVDTGRGGLYGLVSLIRALHAANIYPRFLSILTCAGQALHDGETLDANKGSLRGLIKSIALETPELECREIDIEGKSPDRDLADLAAELTIPGDGPSVAYRQAVRYELGLARVDLSGRPLHAAPLTQGGLYLISGGLGGVGIALAEWLHRHYAAKLLLLGRTSVSELTAPTRESNRKRAENCAQLKTAGVDFFYAAGDVADAALLKGAIASAEIHFSAPLLGVFHLAGELAISDVSTSDVRETWIRNTTPEQIERVLRAKIDGTVALFEALDDRPESLFVGFSSALGVFGAQGFGAYCAANSALDALCEVRRRTHPQTYSLGWAMWDRTGMSASNSDYLRELYATRGYESFPPSQGFQAMFTSLCRRLSSPLIGLDAAKPAVRKYVFGEVYPLNMLAAEWTPENVPVPADIHVEDAFGVDAECRRQPKLEADSRVDDAPQTPTGKELASIWKEILHVDTISRSDRFLALGGDSLGAIQVVNRLREVFGVHLSFRDILQRQTLEGLSQWIDETRLTTPAAAATAGIDLDVDLDNLSDGEIDKLMNQLVSENR